MLKFYYLTPYVILESHYIYKIKSMCRNDWIFPPCNYCYHPWCVSHKSYHISDHASWNFGMTLMQAWDHKKVIAVFGRINVSGEILNESLGTISKGSWAWVEMGGDAFFPNYLYYPHSQHCLSISDTKEELNDFSVDPSWHRQHRHNLDDNIRWKHELYVCLLTMPPWYLEISFLLVSVRLFTK